MTITAGVFGSALHAQANPDSLKLHNDCRLAEQVLTTGQPAQHRQWALTIVGLCGREAVPALLSTWSSVAPDRPSLELLVTSTRAYASPQVVGALFGTLNEPSRPLEVRVASLLVLLTYADPSVVPSLDNFIGDSTDVLITRYDAVGHPYPVGGREGLADTMTEDLRRALTTVAASDPDSRMRLAARVALLNRPLR